VQTSRCTLLNAIPNESLSTSRPSSYLPIRLACLRERTLLSSAGGWIRCLSIAEDTLSSKALHRLKKLVGNDAVSSVPNARALGLGSLSLENVSTLTSRSSRRSAALRDGPASGMRLSDNDNAWENFFSSLPLPFRPLTHSYCGKMASRGGPHPERTGSFSALAVPPSGHA